MRLCPWAILIFLACPVAALGQGLGPALPIGESTSIQPQALSAEAAPTAASQGALAEAVSAGDKPLGVPRPAHEQRSLATDITDGKANSVGWFRVLAALAGTVLVAFGAAAAARKLSGGRIGFASTARAPSGLVEVLARYPIAPRQHLLVLKLDRRVLVLSQSAGGRGQASGLSTLTEITDPEEVASILLKTRDDEGDSIAAKFRDAMDRQQSVHEAFATDESDTIEPQRLGRLSEIA